MDYKTMTNEEIAQFLSKREVMALDQIKYSKNCYGLSSEEWATAYARWAALSDLLDDLQIS